MVKRRRKCKTIGEWDSQYQLHSRPLHEMRLDPNSAEGLTARRAGGAREANGEVAMWLGLVASSAHRAPLGPDERAPERR